VLRAAIDPRQSITRERGRRLNQRGRR
jgi:hypothetical protein